MRKENAKLIISIIYSIKTYSEFYCVFSHGYLVLMNCCLFFLASTDTCNSTRMTIAANARTTNLAAMSSLLLNIAIFLAPDCISLAFIPCGILCINSSYLPSKHSMHSILIKSPPQHSNVN